MSPAISVDSGDNKLVIYSEPSTKSWAVFVDCWLCKLFYLGALLGIGLWYFEDWQEAVFDRSSGRLTVTGKSFFQKYVCCGCPGKSVSYVLDEILSVHVRSEDDKSYVVLRNNVTECNCRIYASNIECSQLVSKIQTFLKLDQRSMVPPLPQQIPTSTDADDTPTSEITADEGTADVVAEDAFAEDAGVSSTLTGAAQSDDASSVTSSEESFERVSATDLAEYEAIIENNGGTSGELSPVGPDDDKEIEDLPACSSSDQDPEKR